MDPHTGRSFQLPEGFESDPPGTLITPSELQRLHEDLQHEDPDIPEEDRQALEETVRAGHPAVRVSEEVVQRLRLGDRELRRRKQRRR